jgi:hypothetical protein
MRLLYTLAAAVVLGALALAACNSNDPKGNSAAGGSTPVVPATPAGKSAAHVAPADGVKRVTTVELRDALDKGTALVVDVRPAQNYATRHIKGSVSIPLEQVPTRLGELPRDKMIVTYCS